MYHHTMPLIVAENAAGIFENNMGRYTVKSGRDGIVVLTAKYAYKFQCVTQQGTAQWWCRGWHPDDATTMVNVSREAILMAWGSDKNIAPKHFGAWVVPQSTLPASLLAELVPRNGPRNVGMKQCGHVAIIKSARVQPVAFSKVTIPKMKLLIETLEAAHIYPTDLRTENLGSDGPSLLVIDWGWVNMRMGMGTVRRYVASDLLEIGRETMRKSVVSYLTSIA